MNRPRVAFVNGGILGLIAFDHFLREYLPRQSAIAFEHILLTADLTLPERAFRRVLCQRLWRDGWLGVVNPDLARLRYELNAGLLARRRLGAAGSFDLLHFHRQATAYGSLDLMKSIPSIVSIDTAQNCVIDTATSRLERASYAPNVRLDGAVFRRASVILSTSQWAANSVRRLYPDCRTPVRVLPNPVMLDHFDRRWADQRRARAQAGKLPHLLFMGGDFPRKGGPELLAAWREGAFAGRATLELVTNWELADALPAGVTHTRGVALHTAEWARCWAAADAFVMPTRNEAFGLVYQEAAAAGAPAIGPRHNAVPEIILDGETGILVTPGDRRALINAMDTLIASAELRHRLGTRARAVIEQAANPDRYLETLTSLVLDLTTRGRRRAAVEAT